MTSIRMGWMGAVIAISLGASRALAHEGHDHGGGAAQAPHGGVVKSAGGLSLELLADASGFKLYPLGKDMNAVGLADVKLKATAQVPKKKAEAVSLTESGDHFAGSFDARGAHRYALELAITFKGKKGKVKFQVEPQ